MTNEERKILKLIQANHNEHECVFWGELKQIAERRLKLGSDNGKSSLDAQEIIAHIVRLEGKRLLLEGILTKFDYVKERAEKGELV